MISKFNATVTKKRQQKAWADILEEMDRQPKDASTIKTLEQNEIEFEDVTLQTFYETTL